MRYWELLDNARELRAKVAAFMDSNALAPTPVKYELCFHYILGEDAELKQALDAAIAANLIDDSDCIKELHEKFCQRSSETEVDHSASGLRVVLQQLAGALQSAGKGSSAYGRTLAFATDQLTRADASPKLRTLIDSVASATRLMNENTKELEARVEASTKEVEALRAKMETVRKQSLIDALTGLANRRSFDETLTASAAQAQAEGTPLSVLMCDVDHFKKFNDTWGHATGDQVLRLVAHCVSTNVKGRDTAARYGGEELVVILPKTGLAHAIVVAEQIRRTVESRKIVKKSTGESYGSITLSIGASELRSGESVADLLARADACLYAAKRAGRNRVCGEAPTDAQVQAVAANKNGTAKNGDSGASVMELQFNDQQTEIFVDPEVTLADDRLKKLLNWYAIAAKTGIPHWRDSRLDDLSFIRDVLHLYADEDEAGAFRVCSVGEGLARVLGANPTGIVLSQTATYPTALAASFLRAFEMIRLTAQMKTPLRSFSKSVHHIGAGQFKGESLFLPFASADGTGSFVLAATVFAAFGADTGTRHRTA